MPLPHNPRNESVHSADCDRLTQGAHRAGVSRAQRSMKRSAMMRCRPGIVKSSEFGTIPEQRCTAIALRRIRENEFNVPHPESLSSGLTRGWPRSGSRRMPAQVPRPHPSRRSRLRMKMKQGRGYRRDTLLDDFLVYFTPSVAENNKPCLPPQTTTWRMRQ